MRSSLPRSADGRRRNRQGRRKLGDRTYVGNGDHEVVSIFWRRESRSVQHSRVFVRSCNTCQTVDRSLQALTVRWQKPNTRSDELLLASSSYKLLVICQSLLRKMFRNGRVVGKVCWPPCCRPDPVSHRALRDQSICID